MKRVSIVRLLAAAVLTVLAGCGEPGQQATVEFGKAPEGRRAEFASAVATVLKGFGDLDSQGVQITVSNVVGTVAPQVTIRGGKLNPGMIGKALSVALTNMSFKYPGIGFMATGDGGWRILMPDEMKIPVTGEFGLDFQ